MKKIVLIGKFNEITKDLNEQLAQSCQVQLCSDNVDIAQGMLRLITPDMVVISLVGVTSVDGSIFSLLFRDYPGTTIAVIGSRANEDFLEEQGYLRQDHLFFIRRPVTMNEIVRRIRELLDHTPDTAPKPAAAPARPAPSPAPAHTAHTPAQDPTPTPSPKPERQWLILVVDDNPVMLRTMQSMLARKYRVIFATSGPQAIAAIAKEKPDLILLDYEMPVVNGKMTLEILRSEDSTRDIPVVFLTGMDDANHVKDVLALRPEGYLLKPPSEERIFSTIEEVLSWRRRLEQN